MGDRGSEASGAQKSGSVIGVYMAFSPMGVHLKKGEGTSGPVGGVEHASLGGPACLNAQPFTLKNSALVCRSVPINQSMLYVRSRCFFAALFRNM